MIYIWLSALLFGMVHPGSKVILSSGLSLELFCFAYIGIRLLAQLPFVIKKRAYKISGTEKKKIAFLLGIVGSLLQLSEFAGIANGSNVSTVTFLVYTHPFWSILISKIFFKDNLGPVGIAKLMLALTGIILVIGLDNFTVSNLKTHWVSLFAGLLIASWIKVSNVARKAGFSTLTTNFYYDLMSFICLVVIFTISPNDYAFNSLVEHFKTPGNLLILTGYSILIGLLPNLLFYKGSDVVDSLTAGYILLLEPIIASVTAYIVWGDPITLPFAIGALFILSANIPNEFFTKVLKLAAPTAVVLLFLAISGQSRATANLEGKRIILLEIIPTDSSEYTVSTEKKQIEIAADMGLEKFLQKEKCNIKIEKKLEIGTEERLIEKINEIKESNGSQLVVGLSRTNFARVAAKVAVGSDIRGISVGASASNLGPINKNFMTMVNPWQEQFKLIQSVLKDYRCSSANTLAVFNPGNFLSSNFLNEYKTAAIGPYTTNVTDDVFTNKYHCIFIGLNFSEASGTLSLLQRSKWEGNIIGLGDWNIYSEELLKITNKLPKTVTVSVPTGWIPNSNLNSITFAKDFEKRANVEASPIAAYVFDGVILAAESLCHGRDIFSKEVNLPIMLRKYKGKSESGNLLSEMHVRKLRGLK